MTQHISFKCVEVTQPIGLFYSGAVPAADVLAISFADVRRVEARDIEKIIGIQRELNPKRVAEIKKYVSSPDATFPTSIILAVQGKHAKFDARTSTMTIERKEDVAKIIDGQHRIAGLEGFSGSFDFNVTLFVDMDMADQAMTFATINLQQTKVSKSLVYDLFAFQSTRSPQKTCHTLARLMNREEGSPLQGRIKILGKAIGQSDYEFITQATFCEELMKYISKDPMADRNAIMQKKPLQPASGADSVRLIFRDMFIAKQDAELADIVWSYFEAVASRWPEAWNSIEKGDLLNRTQGFVALMRFLGPVYRNRKSTSGKLSKASVLDVLRTIKMKSTEFAVNLFSPGGSGSSELFKRLLDESGLD